MFTVMGEVGEDKLYCPLLSLLILLLSLSSLIWLTILSSTLNRWVFSQSTVPSFTLSSTLNRWVFSHLVSLLFTLSSTLNR